MHFQNQSFSLPLVAHPKLVSAGNALCGEEWTPCFEAMVYKSQLNGPAIKWHRDGRMYAGKAKPNQRLVVAGVYLDSTSVSNGCLWLLPGSHKWTEQHAWSLIESYQHKNVFVLPDALPLQLNAGDVLLHHAKVVHGSQANTSSGVRRIVYFDFRSIQMCRTYRWFTDTELGAKVALFQYAQFLRQNRNGSDASLHTLNATWKLPAGFSLWTPPHGASSLTYDPKKPLISTYVHVNCRKEKDNFLPGGKPFPLREDPPETETETEAEEPKAK